MYTYSCMERRKKDIQIYAIHVRTNTTYSVVLTIRNNTYISKVIPSDFGDGSLRKQVPQKRFKRIQIASNHYVLLR